MKSRRRFPLDALLLIVLAALVVGCPGGDKQSAATSTGGGMEISVFRPSDIAQNYSDTLFVDYVQKKFGLKLNYVYVPSSVATEKLNLSFATNTYADKLEFVGTAEVNRLAKDDFIVPLNQYIDQLANYRKAYTDGDWKTLTDTLSDVRGRYFILPVKDAKSASSSYVWMFRNAKFQEVGQPVPKTVQELYDGLKAIKKVNPKSTIPNRWGIWNALEGFNLAFRTRFDVWKDPDAGNQIVLGAATDKFRDLLKYMNKLYTEGLLSKEFITMTSEQRMAEFSKGNVYANFQFAGYENSLNSIAADAKLPQDWKADEANLLLSAYPDKGPMQQKWPAFLSFGVALTDRLKDDRLKKTLEYVNWSCSEEGQLFHEFGVAGESYEVKNGLPTYIGKYLDPAAPDGYFGLLQNFGPFGYYVIQNEAHAAAAYPGPSRINEVLKDVDAMDYSAIPYRFTPEEETRQAELGTVISQIRDEYMQLFIMGPKNPNKDADWNEFQTKLKAAGLDEYLKILREANARIN